MSCRPFFGFAAPPQFIDLMIAAPSRAAWSVCQGVVDVKPPAIAPHEATAFMPVAAAPCRFEPCPELHDTIIVIRASGDDVCHLQPRPGDVWVDRDIDWPRRRVPRVEQIIGVAEAVCRIPRPHQFAGCEGLSLAAV